MEKTKHISDLSSALKIQNVKYASLSLVYWLDIQLTDQL
jgi:hypothetical protein